MCPKTNQPLGSDTVWDTWGKRTPFGYVVLMRIPFASLYFKKAAPGQMRTWGIILQRNISHANEQAFWPQNRHAIAGRLMQMGSATPMSRFCRLHIPCL
jgi:hypothetical protein